MVFSVSHFSLSHKGKNSTTKKEEEAEIDAYPHKKEGPLRVFSATSLAKTLELCKTKIEDGFLSLTSFHFVLIIVIIL